MEVNTESDNNSGLQTTDNGSDVLNLPELNTFEEFGHMALIGPTNSGKTTRIKIFLCDQQFKNFDMFIYAGNAKFLKELAECWAAQNFLDGKNYKKAEMVHFSLDNIEKATLYCETQHKDKRKLLFIDDGMLQGRTALNAMLNFISQAKNSNTTCIITMHDSTGTTERKNIRGACRYYVMLNVGADTISRMADIDKKSKIIRNYLQEPSKFKRVLIYDNEEKRFFNRSYEMLNF